MFRGGVAHPLRGTRTRKKKKGKKQNFKQIDGTHRSRILFLRGRVDELILCSVSLIAALEMLRSQDPLIELHDVVLSLLAQNSSASCLRAIALRAREFTQAYSASLYLLDSVGETLECAVFLGEGSPDFTPQKMSLGEGLAGRSALAGKVLYGEEIIHDEKKSFSQIAVPLMVTNQSFGVLVLLSKIDSRFEDGAEEYLQTLAKYGSQVFASLQKLETLSKEKNSAPRFEINDYLKTRIMHAASGTIFSSVMRDLEREVLLIVLKQNHFNKSKSAEALGLNRVTLDKKIQQYGLYEV